MIESEQRLSAAELKKQRIRERYRGIDPDELDVIPATPQENFYEDNAEKRVGVYARVSTDDPRQTSSYELQKNHYLDVIDRHPGWKLYKIYADEGISGTSLQHRDAFVEMIKDCKEHKIDLIVTKSVSRFARNVLDCIGYVRELAAMNPPIGVFFETENIYTLNPNSEMSLSFISTLAQEESHNKSEIMNASVEMRFRRGIFLTPVLLGYDHDEDGNLVINEDEAKTVRLIFFMYLYGYTCREIAETLTELGRKTKKGNTQWNPTSILQILQNERHCGDVLARKTWTPNYLNHKSKKNNHDRNQYRKRDHHEAIISRDDFIAVQKIITNAKYGGSKGFLPELHVIPEGALKGFISVNPRWAGFTIEDYIKACESVYDGVIDLPKEETQVEAKSGDFDLRGFEIARSQFFNTPLKVNATFTMREVVFGMESIRKLGICEYVELLIHPIKKTLAVRPSQKDNRNAIKWLRVAPEGTVARKISGSAFLQTFFAMFGWRTDSKIRVIGVRKQNGTESVLLFDMTETEVFIPNNATETDEEKAVPIVSTTKTVCAYPMEWADNFGTDYYRRAQQIEMEYYSKHGTWDIDMTGKPYTDSELNITSGTVIKENIDQIIAEMRKEVKQNYVRREESTDDYPSSGIETITYGSDNNEYSEPSNSYGY